MVSSPAAMTDEAPQLQEPPRARRRRRKLLIGSALLCGLAWLGNPHPLHHFAAVWTNRSSWALSGRWAASVDPKVAQYRYQATPDEVRDFLLFSTTKYRVIDAPGNGLSREGPVQTRWTIGAFWFVLVLRG